MPDPKVIPTAELKGLYREGGQRQFDRSSLAGISKSLSKCHDVNYRLIGAHDKLRSDFARKLGRVKLIFGVLNAFLGALAAVLALLRFLR